MIAWLRRIDSHDVRVAIAPYMLSLGFVVIFFAFMLWGDEDGGGGRRRPRNPAPDPWTIPADWLKECVHAGK